MSNHLHVSEEEGVVWSERKGVQKIREVENRTIYRGKIISGRRDKLSPY